MLQTGRLVGPKSSCGKRGGGRRLTIYPAPEYSLKSWLSLSGGVIASTPSCCCRYTTRMLPLRPVLRPPPAPAQVRIAPGSLPLPLLLRVPASFLAIAFSGQCLFNAEFLAWLQIEGVPFDFPDDVLLYNLPLEAAERVLQSLAFLEPYLSQMAPPTLATIIRPLPASEPSRLAPAFPSVPCRA
jgi:hypothetical protein